MTNARYALVLASLCLPGLAACGEKPDKQPTIPEPRDQFYWEDIPVPKNFKRDDRQSTEHRGVGKRWLKHFYIGKASLQLVTNFYREKMPEYGWEAGVENLQNGVQFLNYRKNGEKSEIRIEEIPGGFWGSKTQVYVVVGEGTR